ncbi:MAG: hypothetical protein ACTSYC_00715 [Promethearchaeota archaeon]
MRLEKGDLIYLISVIIFTMFMIWNIFFSMIAFNITFLLFYIIMRFLSGFGLILSVSTGFLILFDKISEKIKKRGVIILIIIQIIIPILVIVQAVWVIITSYQQGGFILRTGFLFWVDTILFIYGIGSLLLNLYIRPLINEQFHEAIELSRFKWWKKNAIKLARRFKRRYFNLKKEHAKAQIQDQMTVHEILVLWQHKFAIHFLLIISIGTLFFTPLAFIIAAYWVKIYLLYRKPIKRYEKIALVIAIIWIGLVAILSPFYIEEFFLTISSYYWIVNIFYLIGLILATFLFLTKILKLQGVTFHAMKIKIKDRKIRKLTEQKIELEKKLKKRNEKEDYSI